jgi:hypothetical protein
VVARERTLLILASVMFTATRTRRIPENDDITSATPINEWLLSSRSNILRMEVDAMTAPPPPEVKAEEGSQKGEKATYKSFK